MDHKRTTYLEPQPEPEPLDAETLAALEEAEASFERGEGVTLEQSTINLRKRIEAWRKAKAEVALHP